MPSPDPPAEDFVATVASLLDEPRDTLVFTALAGGVSSDIWRVDTRHRTVCAKRALARLKVAQDWRAPPERNLEEARWFRFAAGVEPDGVPAVLGHDPDRGILLLSWLDPGRYRNWKTELLTGEVSLTAAANLGTLIGRVHAASHGDAEVARAFDHLAYFRALRLEPYFARAAERNADRAAVLAALIEHFETRRTALVHGDVSPKNVLVDAGDNVVLIDAETACWADPAFDAGFLANHLLLKSIHRPAAAGAYRAALGAFLDAYAGAAPALARANAPTLPRVVPALLLARVDGKSPAEYLTDSERGIARDTARHFLAHPPADLGELFAT